MKRRKKESGNLWVESVNDQTQHDQHETYQNTPPNPKINISFCSKVSSLIEIVYLPDLQDEGLSVGG